MPISSEIQLTLLTGEISATSLSYIAGLFDGEGWIRTQVRPRGKGKGHGLILQIGISNTNKEVLNWIQSIIGGRVKEVNNKRQTPCFQWEVTDRQSIKVIIASLYPYLRIKQNRAKLLLTLLNKIRGDGAGTTIIGGVRRKASYPIEYWEELKKIADAIYMQNTKRGYETYKSGPLFTRE